MLDYAFGSEKMPADVFGDDLAEKFDLIRATLAIDGEEVTVERRWKEPGNRAKVFLNGEPFGAREFCAELLRRLGIPLLHYPQGDPFGKRTWPELSWRSLLRHVYRRQHFWSDLADSQPTSEQHACILQFLGVAEHLFSAEYGELVEQQKQIYELQLAKEQFLNMLHEVSRELLDEEDRGVALTPESIQSAISRVRDEIASAQADREAALRSLTSSAAGSAEEGGEEKLTIFTQQSERLTQLRDKAESIRRTRKEIESRVEEIQSYRENVERELERLKRAQTAGTAMADLKVTHCPACDQPVRNQTPHNGHCYVCGQEKPADLASGTKRIAFELEHLEAERQEADELLSTLHEDITSHVTLEKGVTAEQRKTEFLLRPIRQAAAAILPPEIALLDMRSGQLQERLEQLERISQTFSKREKLTEQIEEIEKAVAALEGKVAQQNQEAHLERAADWLADGMNDYLNAINRRQPRAWPQDKVEVRLRERQFHISVGGGKWTAKLGGTLTLYFLIAYHHGLLRLFPRPECHYPGLLVLDFPPELEDGSSVKDKENFILEPFVELLAAAEFSKTQIIAAGSSFENLAGAHRIELTNVWTDIDGPK